MQCQCNVNVNNPVGGLAPKNDTSPDSCDLGAGAITGVGFKLIALVSVSVWSWQILIKVLLTHCQKNSVLLMLYAYIVLFKFSS